MGQDGVELFHGADVFDLRDKEDVLRHVHAIGIEIPAVHIGAGIAHAPAAARVGVQREADGPVKLLAGFDHGEDKPLCAGVQRVLDGPQFSLGDARERRGAAPLDGAEHVRQDGPRERAVFHVHSHPVVTGCAHHFRNVRRRELEPRTDRGVAPAHHSPYFLCRFHQISLYVLGPLASLGRCPTAGLAGGMLYNVPAPARRPPPACNYKPARSRTQALEVWGEVKIGEGKGKLSEEGGSTPTFPFPLPKTHPFPSKTFVNGAGRGSGGLAARALLEVSRSHRSRGCRIFCCNVSGFFELLRRNAVPTNLRPSRVRDRCGRRV